VTRKLTIFASGIVVLLFFSAKAFGCSCPPPPPESSKSIEEKRSEKRSYFLTEFSGAAFVGKIIKRERVNVNWVSKTLDGEPSISQMYRYTIRVKEYWLGVNSRTVIVYGEPTEQIFGESGSGSSCGFKLKTGRTLFFTPSLYQNNLTIGMCDYAGAGSAPDAHQANEFRKMMGEPKRF